MAEFIETESSRYSRLLSEAKSSDLTDIWRTGSVGVGKDDEGRPCIYFIPELARKLLSGQCSESVLLRKMILLFILTTDEVAKEEYSVVYGYSSISWITQSMIHKEYYHILPKRFKKNVSTFYILHPQFSIHVFFKFAKLYIGTKFFKKLHYVHTIAAFQALIPPHSLTFPPEFLQWEEINVKNASITQVMPDLTSIFDVALVAPRLLVRCANFIINSGFDREGLFRISGDPVLFALAKERMRCNCGKEILFSSPDDEGLRAGPTDDSASRRLASKIMSGGSVSHSYADPVQSQILITDVDTAAQLLKAMLRELPVPVFTFEAFHTIIKITEQFMGGSMHKQTWKDYVYIAIDSMPFEHSKTLQFLLKFMAAVTRKSADNKLTPETITLVFGPTLMRPEVDDPMKALTELKVSQMALKLLLLDVIEDENNNMEVSEEDAIQFQISDDIITKSNNRGMRS